MLSRNSILKRKSSAADTEADIEVSRNKRVSFSGFKNIRKIENPLKNIKINEISSSVDEIALLSSQSDISGKYNSYNNDAKKVFNQSIMMSDFELSNESVENKSSLNNKLVSTKNSISKLSEAEKSFNLNDVTENKENYEQLSEQTIKVKNKKARFSVLDFSDDNINVHGSKRQSGVFPFTGTTLITHPNNLSCLEETKIDVSKSLETTNSNCLLNKTGLVIHDGDLSETNEPNLSNHPAILSDNTNSKNLFQSFRDTIPAKVTLFDSDDSLDDVNNLLEINDNSVDEDKLVKFEDEEDETDLCGSMSAVFRNSKRMSDLDYSIDSVSVGPTNSKLMKLAPHCDEIISTKCENAATKPILDLEASISGVGLTIDNVNINHSSIHRMSNQSFFNKDSNSFINEISFNLNKSAISTPYVKSSLRNSKMSVGVTDSPSFTCELHENNDDNDADVLNDMSISNYSNELSRGVGEVSKPAICYSKPLSIMSAIHEVDSNLVGHVGDISNIEVADNGGHLIDDTSSFINGVGLGKSIAKSSSTQLQPLRSLPQHVDKLFNVRICDLDLSNSSTKIIESSLSNFSDNMSKGEYGKDKSMVSTFNGISIEVDSELNIDRSISVGHLHQPRDISHNDADDDYGDVSISNTQNDSVSDAFIPIDIEKNVDFDSSVDMDQVSIEPLNFNTNQAGTENSANIDTSTDLNNDLAELDEPIKFSIKSDVPINISVDNSVNLDSNIDVDNESGVSGQFCNSEHNEPMKNAIKTEIPRDISLDNSVNMDSNIEVENESDVSGQLYNSELMKNIIKTEIPKDISMDNSVNMDSNIEVDNESGVSVQFCNGEHNEPLKNAIKTEISSMDNSVNMNSNTDFDNKLDVSKQISKDFNVNATKPNEFLNFNINNNKTSHLDQVDLDKSNIPIEYSMKLSHRFCIKPNLNMDALIDDNHESLNDSSIPKPLVRTEPHQDSRSLINTPNKPDELVDKITENSVNMDSNIDLDNESYFSGQINVSNPQESTELNQSDAILSREPIENAIKSHDECIVNMDTSNELNNESHQSDVQSEWEHKTSILSPNNSQTVSDSNYILQSASTSKRPEFIADSSDNMDIEEPSAILADQDVNYCDNSLIASAGFNFSHNNRHQKSLMNDSSRNSLKDFEMIEEDCEEKARYGDTIMVEQFSMGFSYCNRSIKSDYSVDLRLSNATRYSRNYLSKPPARITNVKSLGLPQLPNLTDEKISFQRDPSLNIDQIRNNLLTIDNSVVFERDVRVCNVAPDLGYLKNEENKPLYEKYIENPLINLNQQILQYIRKINSDYTEQMIYLHRRFRHDTLTKCPHCMSKLVCTHQLGLKQIQLDIAAKRNDQIKLVQNFMKHSEDMLLRNGILKFRNCVYAKNQQAIQQCLDNKTFETKNKLSVKDLDRIQDIFTLSHELVRSNEHLTKSYELMERKRTSANDWKLNFLYNKINPLIIIERNPGKIVYQLFGGRMHVTLLLERDRDLIFVKDATVDAGESLGFMRPLAKRYMWDQIQQNLLQRPLRRANWMLLNWQWPLLLLYGDINRCLARYDPLSFRWHETDQYKLIASVYKSRVVLRFDIIFDLNPIKDYYMRPFQYELVDHTQNLRLSMIDQHLKSQKNGFCKIYNLFNDLLTDLRNIYIPPHE